MPLDSSALGKDDFMKLLLAQLANQDPTAPQDDQAFVAQLAQFAQLEASQGTNTRLDTLVSAQAASQQTQAVGFIGKSVDFRTDTMSLEAGLSTTSQVSLTSAASAVTVGVLDSTGKEVRTMKMGPQLAGAVNVTWDGNDDGGNQAAARRLFAERQRHRRDRQGCRRQPQRKRCHHRRRLRQRCPQAQGQRKHVTMSQVTSINERNTQ